MNKIFTIVLLIALAVGLISLSINSIIPILAQTGTSISITPTSSAPTNKIFYDPSPANVKVDVTVIWTNNDATLHTATSGIPDSDPSGEFDSSYLAQGNTFSAYL